jgi:Bacteriophage T4-like portal protein (Gp20)
MSDTSLYARLKKLFSTNVIVRNVGGKKLRVADTDNIQNTMSNAMRDRYSRIHSGTGYASHYNSQYGSNMAFQAQRLMLFRDYDTMDQDPIIASALDIYADESTVKNEYGDILTINTENQHIKDVLHNLYYDILNIEFNLWPWTRNLCKYGDFFLFLEISPEYGIHNVMPLSHYDTVRVEGSDIDNPYYVYFETLGTNGFKQKFDNYEIAHFRMLSDTNFLPYGKSEIESARRIFRQLILMEDAMMIHRIMRAPEKRVFKIDIGNIPPNEVDTFIQKLMDRTKKVPYIDQTTGDYNLRYNMQNLMEDFYLPVRGSDSGTNIENLAGMEFNPIEDIEYLRNKMMAALKIPKAFLGYDENVNGKATLAAEDVRFARTVERIQRIIISELTKIGIVHLYAQGFTDADLVGFSLSLTNPSTIYEQEKINLWQQKIALVTQMQQAKMFSSDWMFENIFDMPKAEFDAERQKIVLDTKRAYRLAQIEQGLSDPMKFGFPQDRTPEENMQRQQAAGGNPAGGGGGAPEVPPGSAPSTGGAGVSPQSIDDLPTAEDLGIQEEEVDDEEETRGQPPKNPQYAQDSHVRGRDPLGFKERYKALHVAQKRKPAQRTGLSMEVRHMLDRLTKIDSRSELLTEQNDLFNDSGTFLDERNILPKTEDI